MDLQLAPGHFTKAMVTTTKPICQAPAGAQLRIIIEFFRLVKEGGKKMQVYSDGHGFPFLCLALNPEDMEEYFTDITLIPRTT